MKHEKLEMCEMPPELRPVCEPEVGAAAIQLVSNEEQELNNSRIARIEPIYSPQVVKSRIEQSAESSKLVAESRQTIANIMREEPSDPRLLVIIGPCSIHDEMAAFEYSEWVSEQRNKYSDHLEIVMRTYLEKPRTTTGWKGLINDPDLDGSSDINSGLLAARNVLHQITKNGVPTASELLYTNTPQHLSDLMCYGSIGARTTESQLHRELASGMSMPVGFKNGTGGSIQIAADAIKSANAPHNFIGIDDDGKDALVATKGNPDCHLILRGSTAGPNYDEKSVALAEKILKESGVNPAIMIDASHANSAKDYRKQPEVVIDIAWQIAGGSQAIRGVMIESNLVEGSQKLSGPLYLASRKLKYGKSITDGCSGLEDSEEMLANLAGASAARMGGSKPL